MFFLTLTRKLYKVLSSDASPTAIAVAAALGVLAGCVPVTSGLTLFLLAVVLVFRVHIAAALLAWGLTRVLAKVALVPLFLAVGESLLEVEALRGLWTWLLNLPIVAWFGLHRYAILGGAVVGLALGLALVAPVRLLVISYRRWLHDRVSKNRFFRWLTSFWLVRALRFVFVGGTP